MIWGVKNPYFWRKHPYPLWVHLWFVKPFFFGVIFGIVSMSTGQAWRLLDLLDLVQCFTVSPRNEDSLHTRKKKTLFLEKKLVNFPLFHIFHIQKDEKIHPFLGEWPIPSSSWMYWNHPRPFHAFKEMVLRSLPIKSFLMAWPRVLQPDVFKRLAVKSCQSWRKNLRKVCLWIWVALHC